VVLAFFGRLRRERQTTIVLVTHDEAVASAADRIVHMVDGRVVPSEGHWSSERAPPLSVKTPLINAGATEARERSAAWPRSRCAA